MKSLLTLTLALALSLATLSSHASGRDDDNAIAIADATADAKALADASALATSTSAGGSATVNNNARALSLSGSGMEIRDCIATHAILFGLWQGTHINKPCVAIQMDLVGKYEEAAKLRCSMYSFKRVFGRGQKCIDAIILSDPPEPLASPEPPIVYEDDDEDDEVDREYADISARLDAMDAARAANVRRYNRDKAAQKKADEEFYGGYIEKFEMMQQTEKPDICCTTEEQPNNE